VAAHGILRRPSEDVDLFADWHRRAAFPAAVDAVIAAYIGEGFQVSVDRRLDTFARLHLTAAPRHRQPYRVELVVNWRAHPPVNMEIGPVPHADDVSAGQLAELRERVSQWRRELGRVSPRPSA
jgi:hypothetical protein